MNYKANYKVEGDLVSKGEEGSLIGFTMEQAQHALIISHVFNATFEALFKQISEDEDLDEEHKSSACAALTSLLVSMGRNLEQHGYELTPSQLKLERIFNDEQE